VLARVVVAQLTGGPATALDRAPCLTRPFEPPDGEWQLMLSGGVAECLEQDGAEEYLDLGPALAIGLLDELAAAGLASSLRPARHRLRATVIGGLAVRDSGQRGDRARAGSGRAAGP